MTTVTHYSQRGFPLARVGTIAEASTLPQDEATAVAVVAALHAQHPARYPGAFIASIDRGDGTEPLIVDEDDPRVKLARGVFLGLGRKRPYSASELASVREAVIAAAARQSSTGDRPNG